MKPGFFGTVLADEEFAYRIARRRLRAIRGRWHTLLLRRGFWSWPLLESLLFALHGLLRDRESTGVGPDWILEGGQAAEALLRRLDTSGGEPTPSRAASCAVVVHGIQALCRHRLGASGLARAQMERARELWTPGVEPLASLYLHLAEAVVSGAGPSAGPGAEGAGFETAREALGRVRDRHQATRMAELLPPLVDAAGLPRKGAAELLLWALGHQLDPTSRIPILRGLRSRLVARDPELASRVVRALGHLGKRTHTAYIAEARWVRARALGFAFGHRPALEAYGAALEKFQLLPAGPPSEFLEERARFLAAYGEEPEARVRGP